MANTLATLKSLPCPAGDNCTAFQCLFGHSRDAIDNGGKAASNKSLSGQNIPLVPSTARGRPLEDNKDEAKEGLQRKRIKLEIDSTTVAPQHTTSPNNSSNIPVGRQGDQPISTAPMMKRDGLGHSLGRSTISSIDSKIRAVGHEAKPQQPSTVVSVVKANSSGPVPESRPKQSPRGPEALNPRLLKQAPASHATRVALVKALHTEFRRLNDELKKTASEAEKKWLLSDQELIVKTLDDEQEIAIKKTAIYNTSIRNKIMTYKRMNLAQWKEERSKLVKIDNSEDHGPAAATEVQPLETGLTSPQELQFLHRLVCNLNTLGAHGYISKIPSTGDIEAAEATVKASGNTEICDRCTRRFQVFPGRRETDGALSTNGPCTYHPGKPYFPNRVPGERSKGLRRFKCCQRNYDDEAGGCTTSQHHVFKTTDPNRLATVLNFVNTPSNPEVPKDRAVSFDCEMGYTVRGLELIRLTVVSWPAGDVLLDILIQPVGEVLDLNTRFSGVRPEDMARAERWEVGSNHQPTVVPTQDGNHGPERRLKIASSPKVARDLLFTMISAETPLIGHGLENDLNAVRIVHPTCIDTVLLWPHSRGLPMRNGLKYLMETKLGRKIQLDVSEGSPEGHDSAEDARAAGDLVRLKIRDEWKLMQMKGWTIDATGGLEDPGEGWTIAGVAKVKKSNIS